MSVEELKRIWKVGERGVLLSYGQLSTPQLAHITKLTLRPTGLSPPIYRDQLDYEVIERSSDRAHI
jgi:hypothetical protein